MSTQDKAEKTIKPTQRKRREARMEGSLPRARELSNIATLAVALIALFLFGGFGVASLGRLMGDLLSRVGTTAVTAETTSQLFWETAFEVGQIIGPLFISLLATAILFSMLFQGGWNISFRALRFQPNKFNPVKGLKRMLISANALMNLLRTFIIVVIVSWFTWDTLMSELDRLPGLLMAPLPQSIQYTAGFIFAALFKVLLLLIVVAIMDVAWNRHRHEEQLKMTRQEFKEDMKMTEGNPLIRRKIRTIQYQMSRRRMLAEVPKADVVITNPTHFAVALLYEAEKRAAPEVIAKGRGYLAERIIEIAIDNDIPRVENQALAQALYHSCEVGDLVPPDLYRAVAEVLAYVYKLKDRVPA